jgi:hypothetical protein
MVTELIILRSTIIEGGSMMTTSFPTLLKDGAATDDIRQVLADSPDVLVGVTDQIAASLAASQIETVYQLGVSPLFGAARQLGRVDRAETGLVIMDMAPGRGTKQGATHRGAWVGSGSKAMPRIERSSLSGLEGALGFRSMSEMAVWPPYLAARAIISEAFVGSPSSLAPATVAAPAATPAAAEVPGAPSLDQYGVPSSIPPSIAGPLESMASTDSLHPVPSFPTPTAQDLGPWDYLIDFQPDASVLQAIERRSVALQPIGSAGDGSPVTLDYYPVQVLSLPTGYTMEQLLEDVRDDLTTADILPSIGAFRYFSAVDASRDTPPKYSTSAGQDEASWLSNDPVGSLFSIFIPIVTGILSSVSPRTDGTVVCSQYSPDRWLFSTCASFIDGNHPVAGTREFGYREDPDLGWVIYTRGAARPYLPMWIDLIGAVLKPLGPLPDEALPLIFDLAFKGEVDFWTDFQERVAALSTTKGCTTEVASPTVNHYDWQEVLAGHDGAAGSPLAAASS